MTLPVLIPDQALYARLVQKAGYAPPSEEKRNLYAAASIVLRQVLAADRADRAADRAGPTLPHGKENDPA